MHIQHKAIGNTFCLAVLMLQKGIIQIFKDWHVLRHRIFKISIVDMTDTLVNDTLLIIFQTVLSSGNQITEGNDKITL